MDRLLRSPVPIEGSISPTQLPDLIDYLASGKGEIQYQFSGNTLTDQLGTKKHRVKCIISGWFEVADTLTLEAVPFTLDVTHNLVLVATEAELPPLEAESDDEDYIVCGAEFDVMARLQEEILLNLPVTTPRGLSPNAAGVSASDKAQPGDAKTFHGASVPGQTGGKQQSPFAKLAALKKSG